MRVVALVAADGTGQRTCFPFRPQPQVNAKEAALGRQAGHFGNERLGKSEKKLVVAQSASGGFPLARRLLERGAFVTVDHHHVHVGAVIEFLATELPEPDDAQFRSLPAAAGILMKGLPETFLELFQAKAADDGQANVRDIRYFLDDLSRPAQTGQISGPDAEHFLLLELAQNRVGFRVIPGPGRRCDGVVYFPLQSFFSPRFPECFDIRKTV